MGGALRRLVTSRAAPKLESFLDDCSEVTWVIRDSMGGGLFGLVLFAFVAKTAWNKWAMVDARSDLRKYKEELRAFRTIQEEAIEALSLKAATASAMGTTPTAAAAKLA